MQQAEPPTHHYRQAPPPPRRKQRNFFLPLLLLGFFLFLFVMIGGMAFFFLSANSPKPVEAKRNSVLHLTLSGAIPEYQPPNAFDLLFNKRPIWFVDYLDMIRKAERDPKIEGIFLEVHPMLVGWAQLQELRDSLINFKKSGKWIVAYGEIWQEDEYYLASAADEIYLEPESMLFLDGLMSRTSFYGDTLQKYGVGVHVEAFGDYKTYGDAYRYNSMTEPHREAIQTILEGLRDEIFVAVAASRNLSAETLESAFEGGVYDPGEAVALGFVDDLQYKDQVLKKLAQKTGRERDEPRMVKGHQFIPLDPNASAFGDTIAIIYAVGGIQPGNGESGAFGDLVVTPGHFISQLKAARENPSVKAIVIRVDSPGGSALASDVIWREIQRTREMGKPVIASMGNVAASGGYYIAMACQKIVAQPGTITGSIGVVAMRFNFEQLYSEFLVNVEVLKTHPHADFFDPARELTEKEINAFHSRTFSTYKAFVGKAADSRGLDYAELDQAAQGRPWLGSDALEFKLIDRLGGLQDALQLAAEEAGLDDYEVRRYPEQGDFFSKLAEGDLATSSQMEMVRQVIPAQVRMFWDFAHAGNGEHHIYAISPFSLTIE